MRRGRPWLADRLDLVLSQLGLVSDDQLAAAAGEALGLASIGPEAFPREAVAADLFRSAFLRHARVLLLAADEAGITIAVADPLDRFTPKAIAAKARRPVTVRLARPRDIDEALTDLCAEAEAMAASADPAAEPSATDLEWLRDLGATPRPCRSSTA